MKIRFNTKYTIKKNFERYLDLVGCMDWTALKFAIDDLECSLKKYYMSYGIPWDNIEEIISEMRWARTHFTVDRWRQEKMYVLGGQLVDTLEKDTPQLSLAEEIHMIYENMQEDVSCACRTGELKYLEGVHEDCTAFRELAAKISSEKPELYDKYVDARKNTGPLLASMTLLAPVTAGGKSTPRSDAVKTVHKTFSQLAASIEELLAGFDKPIISKEMQE